MLKTRLRLRFESLEDRRMLVKADVVFIFDESFSGESIRADDWLTAVVSGDANLDGDTSDSGDTLSLAQRLASAGIDEVRYGLVGFGEFDQGEFPNDPGERKGDITERKGDIGTFKFQLRHGVVWPIAGGLRGVCDSRVVCEGDHSMRIGWRPSRGGWSP